jgi:hypothetical protein
MDVVDRFLELLEKDARHFDDLTRNFEELIPYLASEQQQAWARAEIANRRSRAAELRALAQLTKNEHGR